MLLAEDGKLGVDDLLARHVPGLPEAWQGVTPRHLLTHTSGIADYEEIMGYVGYRQVMRPEQVIAVVATRPLDFAPGERFNYSNTGYFLLTLVIEKASGQPFTRLLHQRVLLPAGMLRTGSSEPTRVMPRRAAGYEFKDGALQNRDAMQPSATGGAPACWCPRWPTWRAETRCWTAAPCCAPKVGNCSGPKRCSTTARAAAMAWAGSWAAGAAARCWNTAAARPASRPRCCACHKTG